MDRQRFTAEFKREAVRLLVRGDKLVSASDNTLSSDAGQRVSLMDLSTAILTAFIHDFIMWDVD